MLINLKKFKEIGGWMKNISTLRPQIKNAIAMMQK